MYAVDDGLPVWSDGNQMVVGETNEWLQDDPDDAAPHLHPFSTHSLLRCTNYPKATKDTNGASDTKDTKDTKDGC